jgi:hypothetical protein
MDVGTVQDRPEWLGHRPEHQIARWPPQPDGLVCSVNDAVNVLPCSIHAYLDGRRSWPALPYQTDRGFPTAFGLRIWRLVRRAAAFRLGSRGPSTVLYPTVGGVGHSLGHSICPNAAGQDTTRWTSPPTGLARTALARTCWTTASRLVIERSSVRIRPRAPKPQVRGYVTESMARLACHVDHPFARTWPQDAPLPLGRRVAASRLARRRTWRWARACRRSVCFRACRRVGRGG